MTLWTKFKVCAHRKRCLENGFFWNEDLAKFVATYGGKEFKVQNDLRRIQFGWSILEQLLNCTGESESMAAFLEERAAPVGWWNADVIFFLTESGELFGYADGLVTTYGEGCHWREGMKRLLVDPSGITIGHVAGDEHRP